MKVSPLRRALQQCDLSLHLKRTDNYQSLLRRVCLAHSSFTWSQVALEILSVPLDKEGVLNLVKLADSLSAQLYPDAASHFAANQFSSLVRKYPFPTEINPFDPEGEAVRKFDRSEHLCSRVNQRFKARRLSRKTLPFTYEIQAMTSFIAYAIGDAPDLGLIYDNTGFGPGASIGTGGNATSVLRKLSKDGWSVSPGAHHWAFAAVMRHAQVREFLFPNPGGFTTAATDYDPRKGPFGKKVTVTAYNNIAFVPKTARTFRSIAVEPLLNGFVQKGVDVALRLFLKRIGIDLSDQSVNSEMARQGSLPNQVDPLVTIDLSSASDSISIELVREVLPPDWFEFLNSIRSTSYSYKGVVKRYSKFCSMGNGFCFPLETLLFVAACVACGARSPGIDFRVYGDDIIVRQSVAPKVIRLLKYLGFSTNVEKTFLQGPFRESCGRDWFGGVDVRPYTLDFELNSVQSLFKMLNGVRRNNQGSYFFEGIRPFLLSLVPTRFRFFRPYPGPEDSGIDSHCDEFLSSPHVTYRFYNGTGQWRWKELITSSRPDKYPGRNEKEYALACLYGALTGVSSDQPFSLRRETKTKVRLISHPGATSQWLPPVSIR